MVSAVSAVSTPGGKHAARHRRLRRPRLSRRRPPHAAATTSSSAPGRPRPPARPRSPARPTPPAPDCPAPAASTSTRPGPCPRPSPGSTPCSSSPPDTGRTTRSSPATRPRSPPPSGPAVRHVVYTSLSGDGDHLTYALAHRWTERRLRRSATLDWTILRNGLYAEFLTWIAAPDAENRITGPLGGKLAAVARADLADVAVAVATDPAAHRNRVYELVGERPLGGADLAAALGATYAPGSLADARAAVAASGAVPFQVPMLASTYSAIAHGFLDGTGVESDLRALLGGREPLDALNVFVKAVRER